MNPRTYKMIDNKVWEYLETLGIEAKGEDRQARYAYYKLLQISRVCIEIRNEVRK